jgi:hypothetical protein
MLETGLDQVNRPYAGIPLGTMISEFPGGRFEAAYDVDAKKMMADTVRAQHRTVPHPLEDEK